MSVCVCEYMCECVCECVHTYLDCVIQKKHEAAEMRLKRNSKKEVEHVAFELGQCCIASSAFLFVINYVFESTHCV